MFRHSIVRLPSLSNILRSARSRGARSLDHSLTNNLDAVPPIHVLSNHVHTDKLTTANGGTFTSSSASRSSSQSR